MGTTAAKPTKKKPHPKPGKRQTFEKAVAQTMEQYHKTFEKLARYDAGEDEEPKKPEEK